MDDQILDLFNNSEILAKQEIIDAIFDKYPQKYKRMDNFGRVVTRHLDKLSDKKSDGRLYKLKYIDAINDYNYNGLYKKKNTSYYMLSVNLNNYKLFTKLINDIKSPDKTISSLAKSFLIKRKLSISQITILNSKLNATTDSSEAFSIVRAIKNNVNNISLSDKFDIIDTLIKYLKNKLTLSIFIYSPAKSLISNLNPYLLLNRKNYMTDNSIPDDQDELNLKLRQDILDILLDISSKDILSIFKNDLLFILDYEANKEIKIKEIKISIPSNISVDDLKGLEKMYPPEANYTSQLKLYQNKFFELYCKNPNIVNFFKTRSDEIYDILKIMIKRFEKSEYICQLQQDLDIIFN